MSGTDGGSECPADRQNKWKWDQILRNTGGTKITLTERVNYFDNAEVSRVGNFSIGIDPGTSFKYGTLWCSSVNNDHTFRTDWSGSDTSGNKIAATGPTVTLKKR